MKCPTIAETTDRTFTWLSRPDWYSRKIHLSIITISADEVISVDVCVCLYMCMCVYVYMGKCVFVPVYSTPPFKIYPTDMRSKLGLNKI